MRRIVEERAKWFLSSRVSVDKSFVSYRDEHHVYGIPVVEACQGKPEDKREGW